MSDERLLFEGKKDLRNLAFKSKTYIERIERDAKAIIQNSTSIKLKEKINEEVEKAKKASEFLSARARKGAEITTVEAIQDSIEKAEKLVSFIKATLERINKFKILKGAQVKEPERVTTITKNPAVKKRSYQKQQTYQRQIVRPTPVRSTTTRPTTTRPTTVTKTTTTITRPSGRVFKKVKVQEDYSSDEDMPLAQLVTKIKVEKSEKDRKRELDRLEDQGSFIKFREMDKDKFNPTAPASKRKQELEKLNKKRGGCAYKKQRGGIAEMECFEFCNTLKDSGKKVNMVDCSRNCWGGKCFHYIKEDPELFLECLANEKL